MSKLSDRIKLVLSLDPGASAVEFEGRWYSWGELGSVVGALTAAVDAAGAPRHCPIGLVLRNSPEMIGAMLATIAGERCIVTLNPHQGDQKLGQDIRDLRVPVIVAHSSDWLRPGFAEAARAVGALGLEITGSEPAVRPVAGLESIAEAPHRLPMPGVAVEMLTSGTTGAPKRVQLDYAAFERTIAAAGEHYRSNKSDGPPPAPKLSSAVAIVASPFVHMSGLFRTLLNICEGRRIALLDRFRVEPWLDLVRRYKPKAVALVPTALRMVLDADVRREDLASVKVVTSGSAKLEPETQLEFERKFGVPVLPSYGATEFAGGVAGWTLGLHREWGERKRGSVGRPQPGREIRIVDSQTGAALGTNTPGLLEIRSGGDWVRTTDLGRIDDDGFVWIVGRNDDAILRGGFKIFPADVVRVLRQHPAVSDASVVGIPDSRLGQVPVAAVELRPGATASADDLVQHARKYLSTYQVPANLRIVESLPRTASMKVSQPGVRELFESKTAETK